MLESIDSKRWSVIRLLILFTAFACIYFLVERYFKYTVNADFANSALVWRNINDYTLSYTLATWRPTPDSWYLSVYPLHFLLFWITQSDGPGVLIFATAIFCFMVCYGFASIVEKTSTRAAFVACVFSIVFMPEIMYTHGFIAHPFAHNSTNAWGAIALLIYILNINYRRYFLTLLSAFICLFTISSDMWFAPSFLIPIIITESLLAYRSRAGFLHALAYMFVFVIGYLHVIQKFLNIEIQQMAIVSFDEMITNFKFLVLLIGQTLNIFFVQNEIAWVASFSLWVALLIYVAVRSIIKMNSASYAVIALALSILGIASSYILINNLFKPSSVRYFVNILPCAVAVVLISTTGILRKAGYLVIGMLIATSLYSYQSGRISDFRKFDDFQKYITFLDRNNLTYGYGEFWYNSMEINWVSGGRILVVPAANDKEHGINAVYARPQTMRFWYDKGIQSRTPDRQFIAFSKGYVCPDKEECMIKARKSFGEPDEILDYNNITLYVYNHKLKMFR
ncbi:hypothetical protein [Pantoea eucrina]|uniref:hypothetical protein n=1 Tax=Pantoea eucrina TaxID=472693 RepID=UPI000A216E4C|nr:hypothetical protein [Pantoea eucrina]ORM78354.1 hypothetical protein HA43_08400 [Pantoea eucrina]